MTLTTSSSVAEGNTMSPVIIPLTGIPRLIKGIPIVMTGSSCNTTRNTTPFSLATWVVFDTAVNMNWWAVIPVKILGILVLDSVLNDLPTKLCLWCAALFMFILSSGTLRYFKYSLIAIIKPDTDTYTRSNTQRIYKSIF